MNPVIIIPARMTSRRLPGKPLADIAGKPMIVHVLERASEARVGPVYVACAEQEVADAVINSGGKAILTDPNHPSGTDRISEALGKIESSESFDVVINVQGDLPTLNPQAVNDILQSLDDEKVDIATLVADLTDDEVENPNAVKAIVNFPEGERVAIAEDFKREIEGDEVANAYHHIGIYAYRKKALEKFTNLPQSVREKERKLEQLRAMDSGMIIGAVLVDVVPFGVDTQEDLEKARRILG